METDPHYKHAVAAGAAQIGKRLGKRMTIIFEDYNMDAKLGQSVRQKPPC